MRSSAARRDRGTGETWPRRIGREDIEQPEVGDIPASRFWVGSQAVSHERALAGAPCPTLARLSGGRYTKTVADGGDRHGRVDGDRG